MIYRRSAPTRAFDLRVHDDAQRWRVTFVCIGAILFANVFDPIRTVVRSSVNRKQPSKILRPSRVNIMLKQSETLNIVPIAQNSVFVYRAAPLAPISLRIFRASLRSAIAVFFSVRKMQGSVQRMLQKRVSYLLRGNLGKSI